MDEEYLKIRDNVIQKKIKNKVNKTEVLPSSRDFLECYNSLESDNLSKDQSEESKIEKYCH
jgi:hypothetical protein